MFNCNFYDLTGSTSRDFTSERGTCALAEARLTFTRSRFPDAPVLQKAKPCGQAQENGMPSRKWESRRRQGSRRMDAKVILKLQEMHFVRQPSSTCSFRANMTPLPALWMLEMLTKRQIPKGRFTIAAKHHITIAEIYETELVDIEKAIAHYEQSADYYKGEESNSSANKSLLKVAAYAAQLEQYQKAIEIYEQVGANTMDNPLLKYSAKDYFFKAALCHFIVDELNAKLALEKYEEMFPAFTDSRECKLLKKLLEAHEEQNSEAYTEAVKEFDSISRLDQWLTTMLLRIKKSIQGDGEGDGDLK